LKPLIKEDTEDAESPANSFVGVPPISREVVPSILDTQALLLICLYLAVSWRSS